MAKKFTSLATEHHEFIKAQKIFFVATADKTAGSIFHPNVWIVSALLVKTLRCD